jgi:hypothetical protein
MVKSCAALALTLGMAGASRAQTLLLDNFDDTAGPAASQGDGIVDTSEYRAPFGGDGDFVGRTQFRFSLPAENVTTSAAGSTDGKVAVLELSTNNPLDATNMSFLGTDLITKRNYAVGGGLRMTTRMRVDAATAAKGGMVAAPFMYNVTRQNPPGTLVRDEIDHELITNNSAGPTDNTFTNIWNDGNFASGGSGQTISNPVGFDISAFHDYRTDWTPTSVKWYIDNALVRTVTGSDVPDDPMRAHWNFWAPDNTFTAAYNAGLTPTAAPGTTYRVEVDKVQVDRLNTTLGPNLLVDPSFENQTRAGTGIGGWSLFPPPEFSQSVSYDSAQLVAQDGSASLKVFGPFHGSTDASGAYQNVPAAPGQQFEGSIWAQAPSFDPIKGTQNYATLTLQFCNSSNQVIGSVNFSPGTNQQETAIYDGRDANMIEDNWVQYFVDGVAPTGTAFARINLFFIQQANEGGAVWFDNAELRLLTNNAPAANADFNSDGKVDGADLLIWQRSLNSGTTRATGDANGDGAVNAADLAVWKSHFGLASSTGAAAAVPEPTAWLLSLAVCGGLALGRRRLA